jgi:signal transduction histidine kinase
VGLSSMQERAAMVDGKLEIESEVGRGTSVRLRVPVPQAG